MLDMTIAYSRLKPTWSFSASASSESLASNYANVL